MPGKTASKSRTSATKNSNSKQNTGPNEPQLLQRAKWIEKRSDHAERDGQTLATRNHDVIKSWAEERGGQPATTTREGPPRVLRIDFPGYGGSNLRKIDWNDWFGTFDERDVRSFTRRGCATATRATSSASRTRIAKTPDTDVCCRPESCAERPLVALGATRGTLV